LAGLQRPQHLENLGDLGKQIDQTIRFCADQPNCDASELEILLIFDTAIDSDEHLETRSLGKRQQFAVLFAGPALVMDATAL
jgi:hypothetical protein